PPSHATLLSTHSATTHLYPLSLHDALPILRGASLLPRIGAPGKSILTRSGGVWGAWAAALSGAAAFCGDSSNWRIAAERRRSAKDRKSTRLNSSHEWISYAVFCLKKKKHIK